MRLLVIAVIFVMLLFLSGQEALLTRKFGLVSYLFARGEVAELEALRSENLALRAALEAREAFEAIIPDLTKQGVPAGAYSSYPFNFRNVLMLSLGTDGGVRKGAAVVFKGALVGQVAEVSARTSVVMTVYDPRLELSVRIGARGVDAVLKGGAAPHLTLIANDAAVTAGDIVTAADPALPLGLVIGEVKEVTNEPSACFKEAALSLPYRIQALRFVSVLPPM